MTDAWQAADFITVWDAKRTFPFIEDEKGAYGWGHLDKVEFALKVNDFDRLNAGDSYNEDARYTAKNVQHVYAKRLPNERFTWHGITAETPGAFKLTLLLR